MASNTLHYWRILPLTFDVYFGSGRCGAIGYCVTVRSGIHRLHRMTSTSGEYPSRADCGFLIFRGGLMLNPSMLFELADYVCPCVFAGHLERRGPDWPL
jgi:hypothetical protein